MLRPHSLGTGSERDPSPFISTRTPWGLKGCCKRNAGVSAYHVLVRNGTTELIIMLKQNKLRRGTHMHACTCTQVCSAACCASSSSALFTEVPAATHAEKGLERSSTLIDRFKNTLHECTTTIHVRRTAAAQVADILQGAVQLQLEQPSNRAVTAHVARAQSFASSAAVRAGISVS